MGARGPQGKSSEFKAAMIEFYQQPNTIRATAMQFGMAYGGARKILFRAGVLRPTYGSVAEDVMNEMKQRWASGESQTEIGRSMGIGQLKISRLIAKAGIQFERRSRGDKHGSWKGGRWESGGYVRVWLDRNDPMFAMADMSGYVLEHRLVMANELRRPLLKTETVHHIDGNGMNNAISNLQLRQGRHGRGIVMHCADCGSTRLVSKPLAD